MDHHISLIGFGLKILPLKKHNWTSKPISEQQIDLEPIFETTLNLLLVLWFMLIFSTIDMMQHNLHGLTIGEEGQSQKACYHFIYDSYARVQHCFQVLCIKLGLALLLEDQQVLLEGPKALLVFFYYIW